MKYILCFALCLASLACKLHAQAPSNPEYPPAIPLWSGTAPGALGSTEADKPRLYAFVPDSLSTKAAILVIPGGGYKDVALGYEGFDVARWLNRQGITAFVLDYRVAPYHYPVEIDDGRRAMRLIRAHAAQYGIDPNQLGVWGFSAGGHLASSLGTHCGASQTSPSSPSGSPSKPSSPPSASDPIDPSDSIDALDCRPDFMVLAYPVISMLLPEAHSGSRMNLLGPNVDPAIEREYSNQLAVTAQTPPTFLFATTRDPTVQVENSLDFYRALERANVPVELHIYDYAKHGCGLCGGIRSLSTWPLLLRNWLILHNWLPASAPPLPAPEPNGPGWPPGLTGPGKPVNTP